MGQWRRTMIKYGGVANLGEQYICIFIYKYSEYIYIWFSVYNFNGIYIYTGIYICIVFMGPRLRHIYPSIIYIYI